KGRCSQNSFSMWQLAIDRNHTKALQYQELSLPMAPVRTTHRKETPDQIEYGEAILVALKLKAERQLEVIAPDQQDNLLVFCRLMLDIQAVKERKTCQRPQRLTTASSKWRWWATKCNGTGSKLPLPRSRLNWARSVLVTPLPRLRPAPNRRRPGRNGSVQRPGNAWRL